MYACIPKRGKQISPQLTLITKALGFKWSKNPFWNRQRGPSISLEYKMRFCVMADVARRRLGIFCWFPSLLLLRQPEASGDEGVLWRNKVWNLVIPLVRSAQNELQGFLLYRCSRQWGAWKILGCGCCAWKEFRARTKSTVRSTMYCMTHRLRRSACVCPLMPNSETSLQWPIFLIPDSFRYQVRGFQFQIPPVPSTWCCVASYDKLYGMEGSTF